jgi:hypothetical protein
MWSIMSRILFWSIAKHVLMHVVIFSILGQPWLARSIQSSWRIKPETAMRGSLLPQAASLILPRARRWEALVATALLLVPHARRRLHPMTLLWRCGRCLLLRHAWRRFHPTTPPRPPRTTTMNTPTSKRWTHMNCFYILIV